MITLNDYLTASGKYPERVKDPENTAEIRLNAKDLLARVNAILTVLGITAKVASGFRPSQVNAKVKNAAKRSKHMIGLAIDLEDFDGEIDRRLVLNKDLLEKHGLYLEHPKATQGWAHLQNVPPRSGNRIFLP